MELKNYLVEMLSNIIHDRLQELSEIKNDIKKSEEFKKVEEMFSDVNNVVNVDNEELRNVLLAITDEEDTVNEIISNLDMIKIVIKGMNEGLDLSLDDSQKDLIKGVHDTIDNYCNDVMKNNTKTKSYLETFLSRCEELSQEIGTGVVRSIDVLDEIFKENDVPLEDVIKVKYEILRNNSKNYNMNLNGHVKEEVKLILSLKKVNIDLDSYSDLEKSILVSYADEKNIDSLIDYISSNDISVNQSILFVLLLFSNVDILSSINEMVKKYNFSFSELYKIPGIFVASDKMDLINTIVTDNADFEYLKYIGSYYDLFVSNISILEENGINVSECFNNNSLSLIIPDMKKNITILSNLNLDISVFSVVVINPFLATSISSFEECGLKDYILANPLRLTTSYYRLKSISSNIISARKNGKVIFRSLSDKKNYWLTKDITRSSSEVI
jgi:hypothetical protein